VAITYDTPSSTGTLWRGSAATIAGSKPEISLAEVMALGCWRSPEIAGCYLQPDREARETRVAADVKS